MHQQRTFVITLAIFSQLLSASTAVDFCVGHFLHKKFESFYFEPDRKLGSFHLSGSSFSTKIDVEISDLRMGFYSMEIYNWGFLIEHGEQPYFDLLFTYRGNLTLFGDHNTSGVILATKPFSAQGLFYTPIDFEEGFRTRIMSLEPTASGYLKSGQIQTKHAGEPIPQDWDNEFLYYEGINENEAISGNMKQFLYPVYHVLLGAQNTVMKKIFTQVEAHVESFWQQEIPQINLTGICY